MNRKHIVRNLLITLIGVILAGSAWLGWALSGLPSIESQNWAVQPPSVRITDRSGRTLYEALTSYTGGRNLVVPLANLPRSLLDATVATEDATFYTNPGIEPVGIVRAVFINLQGGQTLSGGSTITQQVARTLLMEPDERHERTLRRKIREAVLAWQLTQRYSKDEILAIYLNQTYYGGMNYGAEAASQTYYGVPAGQMTLAQAAMLAGIPQSPGLYNPFINPEPALTRRGVVLGLMLKQGLISKQDYDNAMQEPLYLASAESPMEAPHFVMQVRARLDEMYTPEQIRAMGGLMVRTTLDLNYQTIAERAIDRQLFGSGTVSQEKNNMNNAAAVVMDPTSGEILALVGSPDYFDSEHHGAIDMTITPRQPGSALKPFIYALAMDPSAAEQWTPATMLLDVSTNFVTENGKSYVPSDYDLQEKGPVLARTALASSLNIPAVATLQHVGVDRLADLFLQMGLDDSGLRGKDISLALGGGEISLLDLTDAYAMLAAGGCAHAPVRILSISDGSGNEIYTHNPSTPVCVLDERTAWLISDILSDDSARLQGFSANSILNIGRPAAAKTGTTSNFHDNWTVGYTPDLTVGVWVGNASNEAMTNVSGISGAGPIWNGIMRSILTGLPERSFIRPEGLTQVKICALSGLLPTAACPYTRLEWFINGTEPTQPDTIYRLVSGADGSPVTVLDLPVTARAWATEHGLALWSDVAGGTSALTPAAQVTISSPQDGSLYYLTSKLPESDQQIEVQVHSVVSGAEIRLYADGQLVHSGAGDQLSWFMPLSAGKHQLYAVLVAVDGQELRSETVRYEVKLPGEGD